MKKRVIAGLLSLMLALSGGGMAVGNVGNLNFDISVSAEEYENDDYIYTIESGGIAIIDYIGDDTNVIIPSEIDGIPVTQLCQGSFYRKDIYTVVIPDTVKIISDGWDWCGVFQSCPKLKSVVIPDSVYKIGNNAFRECTALKSVVISDGVSIIGEWAFYNCPLLETVVIPKSVTTIGAIAFNTCAKLSNVTLNEGLVTIDSWAFDNCPNLKTIRVPKSVRSIGERALGYNGGDVMQNFTLYCYRNSKTQLYAIDNNINYEIISSVTKVNPDFTAAAGTNSVDINWNAVNNAQKYAVCVNTNDSWDIFAATEETFCTLKNLKAGTDYKIAVLAMFNGEWYFDYSKAVTVTTKKEETSRYPVVSYEVSGRQFRLKWTAVDGAEKYGIAVYQSGGWRVKAQMNGSVKTFTSPKMKTGAYKMVVCAKVNGSWDTGSLNKRAFTITIQ